MRLTWQEIKRSFRDQWIELKDVEWDESFLPITAVVGNSGNSRAEVAGNISENSIVIFVGAAKGFVPMQAAA